MHPGRDPLAGNHGVIPRSDIVVLSVMIFFGQLEWHDEHRSIELHYHSTLGANRIFNRMTWTRSPFLRERKKSTNIFLPLVSSSLLLSRSLGLLLSIFH